MSDKLKPGMQAPKSGQYKEVGPRGGFVSNTEITAVAGKTLHQQENPEIHMCLLIQQNIKENSPQN